MAQGIILVTGGAGFIGSHVCDALMAEGFAVKCFDNFATGRLENIAHLEGREGFTLVTGDLRVHAEVLAAVKGVDKVVHLGAMGSVPRSIADPLASEAANLTGTLHVLEACRTHGVQRLVYASSSSVYGDSQVLPKREGEEGHPLSPYAVTKAMDEAYAGLYKRLFGLPVIGLRFFNVFGERQDPQGPYAAVIPRFIQSLLKHEAPQVHGDGGQTRDFTHVGNAVEAVRAALNSADEQAIGRVFNIALGNSTSLLELLDGIRERLAVNDPAIGTIEAQHLADRPGDVRASMADITLARQLIGFNPPVDLATGLDRTVAWYAAHLG
ncbi:MAG: GDP-mannose 4,6-dehydratase [Flavobacteriales bacterium]|nr:GDP-mannose 4,6-dehydratase [Flavobacteriales bacterium]